MRQHLLLRPRGTRLAGRLATAVGLKRALRVGLAYLVTIAALVWLLSRPTFGAAAALLQQARIQPLLLALALIPVLQWLRAWRFSVLLCADPRAPSGALFKLTAQLSALNLVLPFKVGDFSFPVLAQRALGVGVIHAAATMLWCRLTDLCVVFGLLLLYAGLALLPGGETWLRASIFGAAALCLLAPLAASKALDLLVSTIAGARARTATPILRRLPEELAQSVRVLQAGGPRGCCLAATLAIWLTHGWIGYLAALAVADDLTFVRAALAGAASNLAFALPVTGVGGVGPPQAAWTSALQLTGASWETGVATALMAYGCLSLGSLMTAAAMLLFPAHGLRPAHSLPLKSI